MASGLDVDGNVGPEELLKLPGDCCHRRRPTDSYTWTLDRINNLLPHTADNCVVSCLKCNTTRKDKDFLTFNIRRRAVFCPDNFIRLIDVENRLCFHKPKENIGGGPSIVFNRLQEVGLSVSRGGKPVKRVVEFDANALYFWCIGQTMPCGELEYVKTDQYLSNKFGFGEVDIEVPKNRYEDFSEFSRFSRKLRYRSRKR